MCRCRNDVVGSCNFDNLQPFAPQGPILIYLSTTLINDTVVARANSLGGASHFSHALLPIRRSRVYTSLLGNRARIIEARKDLVYTSRTTKPASRGTSERTSEQRVHAAKIRVSATHHQSRPDNHLITHSRSLIIYSIN